MIWRFWSALSRLVGVVVDVRGEEGVLTGSMGSSVGSDRSIHGVHVGLTHFSLVFVIGRVEVDCTLLRFRVSEASMCVLSSVNAAEFLDWLVIFVA